MEEKLVAGLLWAIITVLFVFWVLGFALHFGGGLIHLLLLVIGVMVVINLMTGRGARV
ncbi:MAG: hypothetical protein NVSMB19_07940 [Vulcanimicrobiaceae bacterium]